MEESIDRRGAFGTTIDALLQRTDPRRRSRKSLLSTAAVRRRAIDLSVSKKGASGKWRGIGRDWRHASAVMMRI
jgi:hypothetical protein